jgi:hypothetical protein
MRMGIRTTIITATRRIITRRDIEALHRRLS